MCKGEYLNWLWVGVTSLLTVITFGEAACNLPLGMASKLIPDSNIEGSTVWNNYYAYNARINSTGFVTYTSNPFLKVDLGGIKELSSLDIQGAYSYYVKTFRLFYSIDGLQWKAYTSLLSEDVLGEVLDANTDRISIKNVQLDPTFKARHLAIQPLSWYGYSALRLEFYGCDSLPDSPIVLTNVTADIETMVTWQPSLSPYVIDRLMYVRASSKLTVMAGVSVVFTNPNAGIIVTGEMEVMGSSGLPVLFTSSSLPFMQNQWKGLEVQQGGQLKIIGARIRQGETCIKGQSQVISVVQDSLLDHCLLGVHLTPGRQNTSSSILNGTTFLKNDNGLLVESTAEGQRFSIVNCTFEDHQQDAIKLSSENSNVPSRVILNQTLIRQCRHGIDVSGRDAIVTVHRSEISRCIRGVYHFYYNTAQISILSSNLSAHSQEAVYIRSKNVNVTMENSTCLGNYYCVYVACSGYRLDVVNNIVVKNSLFGESSSGSLYISTCDHHITNITNNTFIKDKNSVIVTRYYKDYLSSSVTLANNTFANGTGNYAVRLSDDDLTLIQYNTLVNLSVTNVLELQNGYNHSVNFNYFRNPESKVDLSVGANFNVSFINATLNYWGSAVESRVKERVCDFFCNLAKARATVVPFFINEHLNETYDENVSDDLNFSGNKIMGGVLRGNFTFPANTRWNVTRSVLVDDEASLILSPNVTLLFAENVGLYVKGKLMSESTEYPVSLEPYKSNLPWFGLWLENIDQDIMAIDISNSLYGLYLGEQTEGGTLNVQRAVVKDVRTSGVAGTVTRNTTIQINNSTFQKCNTAISLTIASIYTKINVTETTFLQNSRDFYADPTNDNDFFTFDLNFQNNSVTEGSNNGVELSFCSAQDSILNLNIENNSFTQKSSPVRVSGHDINSNFINNNITMSSSYVYFILCNLGNSRVKGGTLLFKNNSFAEERSYSGHLHITTNGYYYLEHDILIKNNTFGEGFYQNRQVNQIYLYFTYSYYRGLNITIKNNTFKSHGNTGIYAYARKSNISISDNSFHQGFRAVELTTFAATEIVSIKNNTIDNLKEGVILQGSSDKLVQVYNNTFRDISQVALALYHPMVQITHNNFYNPDVVYNIRCHGTGSSNSEVNATLNYWNTTLLNSIAGKIYDHEFDKNLPSVIWRPFLASENTSDITQGEEQFQNGNVLGGRVSGRINLGTQNSPYIVTSNIIIDEDDVLSLEPGVELQFEENIGISVSGSLQVNGTENQPIVFNSKDSNKKWNGVTFSPLYRNNKDVHISLAGKNSSNEGRVDLEINGMTGTICNTYFGQSQAKVLCRTLGFRPEDGVMIIPTNDVPKGAGPIHIPRLNCNGDENSIMDCSIQDSHLQCHTHEFDVGVRCLGPPVRDINKKIESSMLKNVLINNTVNGLTLDGNFSVIENVNSSYSTNAAFLLGSHPLYGDFQVLKNISSFKSGTGISVSGSKNVFTRKYTIKECSFDESEYGAKLQEIFNVSFYDCRFHHNSYGIRIDQNYEMELVVSKNVFSRQRRYAIYVRVNNNAGGETSNLNISDNMFINVTDPYNNYDYEVYLYDYRNFIHTDWMIADNIFKNINRKGIYLYSSASTGNASMTVYNNSVQELSAPALNIYHGGSTLPMYDINVSSNVFENNHRSSQDDLVLFNFRTPLIKLNISNNRLTNNKAKSGITLQSQMNTVYIHNNVFANNSFDVSLVIHTNNTQISNNIFENPLTPIELECPDFSTGFKNNASFNYWGSSELLEVLPRLRMFETNMEYSILYYLPIYLSPALQSTYGSHLEFPLDSNVIGGLLYKNITLSLGGSPYTVQRSVYVSNDSTLTIEPGVTIYFKNDTGILSHGKLLVGSPTGQKVRMTSEKEDWTWFGLVAESYHDNRPPASDVRLVGGENANEGRLEILVDQEWKSLCSSYYTKRETVGQVFCRMLGYRQNDSVIIKTNNEFGLGNLRMELSRLTCSGNEDDYRYCTAQGYYSSDCENSDIGLVCSGPISSPDTSTKDLSLENVEIMNTKKGVFVDMTHMIIHQVRIANASSHCLHLSEKATDLDLQGSVLHNCSGAGINVPYVQRRLSIKNGIINVTQESSVDIKINQGAVILDNMTVLSSNEDGLKLLQLQCYNLELQIKKSKISNVSSAGIRVDQNYNCNQKASILVERNNIDNASRAVNMLLHSSYYGNDMQRSTLVSKNIFNRTGGLYFYVKERTSVNITDNVFLNGKDKNAEGFLHLDHETYYNPSVAIQSVHITGNSFEDIDAKRVIALKNNNNNKQWLLGDFSSNSIVGSKVTEGVLFIDTIGYNFSYNIFDNPLSTYDVIVQLQGSSTINATRNWWGSASLTEARARILDGYIDGQLYKLDIEPILQDLKFDCSGVNNCSGHGDCIRPNKCRCQSGWTGSSCSDFDCSGVNYCSGHGTCTGSNICTCAEGWSGSICIIPTCQKVNECSGRGVCVLPNTCSCFRQYTGSNCTLCAPNRWGPDCLLCPSCKHGACDLTTGQCICDSVNWAGDLCDTCNETFYGPSCLPLVTVLSVSPSAGPDLGGTVVQVHGHNFPETPDKSFYCKFGIEKVKGTWMSRTLIVCEAPSQVAGIVRVTVSANDTQYTNNQVEFYYYAECPESACGSTLSPPHGQCMFGGCSCNLPWAGADCSLRLLAPEIAPVAPSQTAAEGITYELQLNTTKGSAPISWYVVQGPAGIAIDSRTGLVTWGAVASVNPYNIMVRAKNVVGQQTIAWTLKVDLAYNVTVRGIEPSGVLDKPGTVKVYGSVYNLDGNQNRVAYVEIRVKNKGRTHVVPVFSSRTTQQFEGNYVPRPDDSGLFEVDARHPSDTGFAPRTSWSVRGMSCSPKSRSVQAYLDKASVTFPDIGTLENTGVDDIADIVAKVDGIGGPITGYSINTSKTLSSLPAGEKISYNLTLEASGPARGGIRIVFSNTYGTIATQDVYITLNIRRPLLQFKPSSLTGNVERGTQKFFQLNVTNAGEVKAEDVKVVLPNDNRLSLVSFSSLSSEGSTSLEILPQETALLTLGVTSQPSDPLGAISGSLVVNSILSSSACSFKFYIISLQQLNLTIRVEDEYTYFAEGNPLVSEAEVYLSNPRQQYSERRYTTNETGEVLFQNLYEDKYTLFASAPGHGTYSAVIVPQQSETIKIFLPRIAVTYTWTVEPTTFEDRYIVTLESTFETQVPMPVVTIDPINVNLISYEEGREDVIDFTITNHGLIRADNIRFNLPSGHPTVIFEQTVDTIGSIEANTSISVPIKVTPRLRRKRGAVQNFVCGLKMLYDFFCGGPQTRGVDVTLSRQQPGRPPIPCSGGGSGGPGGGSGGPSGFSGFGGSSYSPSSSTTTYNPVTPLSCDCAIALIKSCLLSYHPLAGCSLAFAGYFDSYNEEDIVLRTLKATKGVADVYMACIFGSISGLAYTAGSLFYTTVFCYDDVRQKCDSSRRRRDATSEMADNLLNVAVPMENILKAMEEVYGDRRIFDFPDQLPWYKEFENKITDNSERGTQLSVAEENDILSFINASDHRTMVQKFLQRWNNTAAAWENGTLDKMDSSKNVVHMDIFRPLATQYLTDTKVAREKGFDSVFDEYENAASVYVAAEKEQTGKDDGVCAKVRIRIVQELVLTREAFNAKLEIENGENSDLEDIAVTIIIKRTYGNGSDATEEFAIGEPTTSGIVGFTGSSGGRLARDTTGTAEWLIVPYPSSAIQDDTLFDVGGRLSYRVGGANFSFPLLPDTITVKPNPSLILEYFHEKYVQGDDPMTPDVKEPVVPFSLAIMVQNNGYGTARALKITSAQPEIIENEKGLLVSFKIVGAQLGTDPIAPSLAIDFGDIPPKSTKVARWLLTSTLMGKFSNYSATFENINPLGDPQLSVMERVGYHDLIHLVRNDLLGQDDQQDDFLVNDIPDEDDFPDRLYDSRNGTKQVVTTANMTRFELVRTEILNGKSYKVIAVEVKVIPGSWFYTRTINDIIGLQGAGNEYLLEVTQGTGKSVIVGKNAWITTHIKDENLFHLFDFATNNTANSTTMMYTVYAGPRNMYAPIFNKTSYHVDGMLTMGSVLFTLDVMDIDGNSIFFSVSPDSLFVIANKTGRVSLASGEVKVGGSYTMNITAYDDGIPSKQTTRSITVYIASNSTVQPTISPSTTTTLPTDQSSDARTATSSVEITIQPSSTLVSSSVKTSDVTTSIGLVSSSEMPVVMTSETTSIVTSETTSVMTSSEVSDSSSSVISTTPMNSLPPTTFNMTAGVSTVSQQRNMYLNAALAVCLVLLVFVI